MLWRTVVLGDWTTPGEEVPLGSVEFYLQPALTDLSSGVTVPSRPEVAELSNGAVVQSLVANNAPGSELEPTTTQYLVTERVLGAPDESYWISVPAQPAGSRTVTDAVLVQGSSIVTSATAAFSSGDVGSYVFTPGVPTPAQILSVISSTGATLSESASMGISGQTLVVGASVELASLRPE